MFFFKGIDIKETESKETASFDVVVQVNTGHEWGRQVVKGVIKFAREVGSWYLSFDLKEGEGFEKLPIGWTGDGVISPVMQDRLAHEIEQRGIPVINIAGLDLAGFSAPCVRHDIGVAMDLGIAHFVRQGIKSFAFVQPYNDANAAVGRHFFDQSLPSTVFSNQQYTLDLESSDYRAGLGEWLKNLPKPVGLIVWGIHQAIAVIEVCRKYNISVPHDVAVLSGNYDELLCNASAPLLSGILVPAEEIGYLAASLLHKKMMGESVPNDIIYLPAQGIMEQSSTDTLAIDDEKLVNVVKYIRENAVNNITMDDVLKAVPISRRSLERKFHNLFGRSPVEEIRQIRIERARDLLANTTLPMPEIADACGYASYNQLSQVFKRVTGMPPREYRKLHKV